MKSFLLFTLIAVQTILAQPSTITRREIVQDLFSNSSSSLASSNTNASVEMMPLFDDEQQPSGRKRAASLPLGREPRGNVIQPLPASEERI